GLGPPVWFLTFITGYRPLVFTCLLGWSGAGHRAAGAYSLLGFNVVGVAVCWTLALLALAENWQGMGMELSAPFSLLGAANRRLLAMSTRLGLPSHWLVKAGTDSPATMTKRVSSWLILNQLDTRFVTYPAGLGIGAAMVGFAQWGVAKQIAELRGNLLAATAGLVKQLAEMEGKYLDRESKQLAEISGIRIAMAEMKTNIALMKRDIADFSKKYGASVLVQKRLKAAMNAACTYKQWESRALQANGEDVLDDIGLDQFDSPSTPNRLTSAAAGRGKDFDVLLGNDWLNEHEAVMSYQDKTLSLACDKGEPVVLPCPPADKSESGQSAVSNPASFLVNALRAKPPLASAKVAARWLRKGGTGVLALITVDNSSTPDPAPAEPDLPPGVSQALNALLDEYADVFAPITSLPPERPVGHAIPLVPDARPSVVPQYRMSQEEHAELKKQVQDLLAKGMIEPSSSPFAAPILFVKKKSGELRMCLDYRQLNKITIRDQYPLPRIDDLFDKLSGCTVFSSLDLQAGYNQIRITPEDVPKTAFRTPDGHYQFKVLSFGLCNAPATFQRVMNDAFAPVLNQCALVYLDDILVMSKSVDEHLQHLRKVFDLLRLNKLFAKQSKSEFMRTTLKFLGHVIFAGAIAVDPEKIKSISSWPVPQSLQQLQSFLGAANFVRKFVHNFSVLAAPLTDLCGKAGDSFLWQNWPADELKAFASLKAAVAQVPMLRLPDHTQPFQVYCDASLQGVGAVLMQDGYPLAYLSKKLSSAERNYTTGEQELLALITACKEWRCYLEGVPFTLFTDHKPLTALPTQKGPTDKTLLGILTALCARTLLGFLQTLFLVLQTLFGLFPTLGARTLCRGPENPVQGPADPVCQDPVQGPMTMVTLGPCAGLPELEAPSAADTSVHYPAAPAHPLELADHLVHGYRLDPAFTAEADLSGMYMDDHGLWRRTGKGTEAVAKAKLCMQAAQQRQAAYANQDRREVHYKVGQMVLLSTKNMRLKPGKARKLLPRFVGPFKVLGLVGQVAVNLQLPTSMSRLHPVFHVSLIKPYTGTDVGFMPPPVEWLDEEPVYYVERLLDHRQVHAGKAKEYLVQWEGYDADHNTWEPRSNLVGCDKILTEYNAAHNLK
ncbi:hypothetical protein QJQ45_022572, partial [Haematococcus lacustris]